MSVDVWATLVAQMKESGVAFEDGLTSVEITRTEKCFGFSFPPDLRAFLQTALPAGPKFPNWRQGGENDLREWLDIPLEGILFDIEFNNFWLEEWTTRPKKLDEAKRVGSGLIASAPKLILIFIHRMIPGEPHLPGNPVFSVHRTDIIYYGFDLADYLRHEFKLPGREPWPLEIRPIRFWEPDRFQTRWMDAGCAFDNRDN